MVCGPVDFELEATEMVELEEKRPAQQDLQHR